MLVWRSEAGQARYALVNGAAAGDAAALTNASSLETVLVSHHLTTSVGKKDPIVGRSVSDCQAHDQQLLCTREKREGDMKQGVVLAC